MPQTSVPVVRPLQHIQAPQLVWLSNPEHLRGETDVPCRLTTSAKIKPNQIFTPGVHIQGVGSHSVHNLLTTSVHNLMTLTVHEVLTLYSLRSWYWGCA